MKRFQLALTIMAIVLVALPAHAITKNQARQEYMRYCLAQGGRQDICDCSFEASILELNIEDIWDISRRLFAGLPVDNKKLNRITKVTGKCVREIQRNRRAGAAQIYGQQAIERSQPSLPAPTPAAPAFNPSLDFDLPAPPPPPSMNPAPAEEGGLLSQIKTDEAKQADEPVEPKPVRKKIELIEYEEPEYFGQYNNEFILALQTGQLKPLIAITKKLDSVDDVRDAEGNYPLHIAAAYTQPTSIEFLLSKGADVNARNIAGQTPLHIAAFSGRADLVGLLLNAGSAIEAQYGEGFNPLFLAIMRQDAASIVKLLDKGASLSAKMADGSSVMHVAATTNNPQIINLMVQRGAALDEPNANGETPLMVSARQNSPVAVYTLLQNGAQLFKTETNGRNAAQIAQIHGSLDAVNAILTYQERKRSGIYR